jgi:uncharacterized protein (TIGR02266 family)
MSASHEEKRVYPRRDLRTAIIFEDEFEDGMFYVYSENISMGGLFLASSIPLRMGTLLFLSFVIPGFKRPIRVTGEVVRTNAPYGGGEGMGIRFVGLSEMALQRLKQFLSS